MKALVFGSLNTDYVYQVDHFVKPGETLASDRLQVFCGGKGLNQSIALSRSGVSVWHAGAAGISDGRMLTEELEKAGVHTELIQKKQIPGGHAIIQTTPEGENSILIYGGANQTISKEQADEVLSHFEEGDFLVLQNEISQIPYIMEKAHERGLKIVLNPSPVNEGIFEMPLSYVDYLILNELEGAALAEAAEEDSGILLEKLTGRYPNARIVLTLGKAGSLYGYQQERHVQPAYEVKAVDTTAAGDTFTGFFIGSIMRGKSVEEALETASRAASIAVMRHGASASIPLLEEVSSSDSVRIRPMQPDDDKAAVSRIYEESWKYAYRTIIPQSYLDSIPSGNWVSGLDEPGRNTIVMVKDGALIGTSTYCRSRFAQFEGFGEIVSVYLLPEYIGRGYGKRLFQAAVRELRALGYEKIFLWVLEENVRARRFYERAGMRCTGEFMEQETGGKNVRETAYVME